MVPRRVADVAPGSPAGFVIENPQDSNWNERCDKGYEPCCPSTSFIPSGVERLRMTRGGLVRGGEQEIKIDRERSNHRKARFEGARGEERDAPASPFAG